MTTLIVQPRLTDQAFRTMSAPPYLSSGIGQVENPYNISSTQRSNSVPFANITRSTPDQMADEIVLRSRKIDRPSQLSSRKSRKFSMAPSSSTSINKDSKMVNKASVLAMAHLIGRVPAAPSTVNEDRAVSGPPHTDDDECTITSIRRASPNETVSSTNESVRSHVSKSKARLRTSLPSYRRLCRTAGVPINSRAEPREATEPATITPDPKDHDMPVVASHVVQTPNGVIAGYMSAMQHSTTASQGAGSQEPNPSIEKSLPSGNSHLQQLRQHRSTVFEDIIKSSITTTLSVRVRASVADEVRLRYAHLLLEHERSPKYAYSVLKARGRRYWVGMYESQEMSSDYVGRQEARETQLIDEIYSRRDRAIAIHFWALYHERMRYADICFELSLPLGALLQWLLTMSS